MLIYRIHICITHLHTKPGVASLFIEDLRLELIEILKTPNVELTGKVNNKLFNQIRVFFNIEYRDFIDGYVRNVCHIAR